MTSQISIDELEDDELRQQFNHLMEAMKDIVVVNPEREEGAYEALNQRIYQEVTDKPILARIVSTSNQTLLSTACSNINLDISHDTIKCLIQAYPSALLEPPSDSRRHAGALYLIASHPEHCILMPWIATNYTWVLDDEYCLEHPPVFAFLYMYVDGIRCTSTTVREYFEAYPLALNQLDDGNSNTLHVILGASNTQECEATLIKWMVERCPSRFLLEKDSEGDTLLHLACLRLSVCFISSGSTEMRRDSEEICKYLIDKCPAAIRVYNNDAALPIHDLNRGCDYRVVREVVVRLLQEYPESIDARPQQGNRTDAQQLNARPPSDVPFIQSMKPFLDEERELKETIASLEESKSSLTEAVTCTNDQLMRSAFTVFDSWVTSFIYTTENKLQLISTQLQDMCNEGLESDE